MIVKYKEKISASSFENGVFHEEKSIITNLNEVHFINPETGSQLLRRGWFKPKPVKFPLKYGTMPYDKDC